MGKRRTSRFTGKKSKARKVAKAKSIKYSFLDKRGRQRRDERGHFVSKSNWVYRQREIQKRLSDKFERQKELERLREQRRKQVLRSRKQRLTKARTKTGRLKQLYKNREKAYGRYEEDSAVIGTGQIPDAHQLQRVGRHYIHRWVYFGSGALDLTTDFIIEGRSTLDGSTLGTVHVGTSYDRKRGQWVGTPTLPLQASYARGKDLLSAWLHLLATQSGQNLFGSDKDTDVWVEIELLSIGRELQ